MTVSNQYSEEPDTAPGDRTPQPARFSHQLRGIAERYGVHVIILLIAMGLYGLATSNPLEVLSAPLDTGLALPELAVPQPTPTDSISYSAPGLAEGTGSPLLMDGAANDLIRSAELHTDIPSRPRPDVTAYTVVSGDTVFGLAEKFGVTPETIVWSNPVLRDDPHSLRPDQVLRIPPVTGLLRDVQAGDKLEVLAQFYQVTVDDIVNWPGNNLDPDAPQLTVGQVLIVPGGKREFVQFVIPQIVRSTRQALPLDAGPGACAGGYSGGAVGAGSFIWPVSTRYVVGNNYWAGHFGLDLAASIGQAIFAADGGVVVFAGWNNWGYGQLVVIDHGNGWQTLYAHNSQVNVGCGQSVTQGQVIAAGGSTGNSSGPHLHFEMNYQGSRPNPFNYLPAP